MLLSEGKSVWLYLYIAQVDLEGNFGVGSLCMNHIYMMLVSLDIHKLGLIVMFDVVYTCYNVKWSKCYTFGLLATLLGLCEVMGLHIHIALVILHWGYE